MPEEPEVIVLEANKLILADRNDAAIEWLREGNVQQWNQWKRSLPSDRSVRCNCLTLDRVDLSGVDFSGVQLHKCTFANGRLVKADFGKQQSEYAIFEGANLRGAVLCGQSSHKFRNADLRNADLTEIALEHADFEGANLSGADFSRAKLTSASFKNALCTNTKGLVGDDCAYWLEKVRYASHAIHKHGRFDVVPWHRIKALGDLPFFGVSYGGIMAIVLWVSFVQLVNRYIPFLQKANFPEAVAGYLPSLSVPWEMSMTLAALVLIAIASTIYKLACPDEVREYTSVKWSAELGKPLLTYHALSYQKPIRRRVTAFCYVGVFWLAWLFVKHIWRAVHFISPLVLYSLIVVIATMIVFAGGIWWRGRRNQTP